MNRAAPGGTKTGTCAAPHGDLRKSQGVREGVHGIVLAGSYPTGQSPLEQLGPRPLLPVAQRPLISYALRWMRKGGLEFVTVCTNTAAREVSHQLGEAPWGLRLRYTEDFTPRGPAGCVRDAGLNTPFSTFVVAHGTSVPVVDIEALLHSHRTQNAAITVAVAQDATRRARPCGVYVFERFALELIPQEGFQDIKEKVIPSLYRAGYRVSTHLARSAPPRVVSARAYLALDHWAVANASDYFDPLEGYRQVGDAVIHETAEVHRTARLLGPVLIGPWARIEADATMVGPGNLGTRSVVKRGAVLSRSATWNDCVIGENAFVDMSIIARGTSVPSAEWLAATVRFNGGPGASRPDRPY